MNFTTQVFQSIGLGYGTPAGGLMERRPRKPEQPILTRPDTIWFVVAGLVMAAATLAVIAGAEHEEGDGAGAHDGADHVRDRQPGASRSPRATSCARCSASDTFSDRTFMVTSLLSAGAIIFATELRFFQRVLDTVELTGNQWLICIGAGLVDRRRLRGLEVRAAPPRQHRLRGGWMISSPYTRWRAGSAVRSITASTRTRRYGLVTFAGVMLTIVATLNTLWGIAAIDEANVFTQHARYIFGDLNTWGWFLLALGIAQYFAAFAIWRGTAGAAGSASSARARTRSCRRCGSRRIRSSR